MRIRVAITPDVRVIKRNYCCVCGLKLKRKIIVLIEKKRGLFVFWRYWLITNGYYCKKCDYEILYSKQKEIKKVQDIYSSRILVNGNTLVKKNKVQKFKDKESGFILKK